MDEERLEEEFYQEQQHADYIDRMRKANELKLKVVLYVNRIMKKKFTFKKNF